MLVIARDSHEESKNERRRSRQFKAEKLQQLNSGRTAAAFTWRANYMYADNLNFLEMGEKQQRSYPNSESLKCISRHFFYNLR